MTGAINGLGDYYSSYSNIDATADKLQSTISKTDYEKGNATGIGRILS